MYYRREDPSIEKICIQAINAPCLSLIDMQKSVKNSLPLDTTITRKLKKSSEDLVQAIPDIENTISEIKNLKRMAMTVSLMNSHIDSALSVLESSRHISNS